MEGGKIGKEWIRKLVLRTAKFRFASEPQLLVPLASEMVREMNLEDLFENGKHFSVLKQNLYK